ncbi:MAG: hypothetical protein ABR915_13575 [Thermoguttaceae bacterium]|jgi:hypothetical protein
MNAPIRIAAAAVILTVTASTALAQWTATIERPTANPKRSNQAYAWVPGGCKTVRGVFITQQTMFEAGITRNEEVRAACAEKDIAVVYAPCGIGLYFITGDGAANIEAILSDLAKATGHPELQFAPLITAGHSTAGIYCRNVAYWKPERVAGVVHIMSGNLQAHIEDYSRSLAGVPVLFINGEWEQYGPDGGNLPGNLRSNMGLRMRGNQQQGQTQWICMRQQILARRAKNPENLMGLVVSRDKSHTQWEGAMNGMVAQFIRSVADARIPKGNPDGKTAVRCLPVKAAEGWLLDADIKAPKFPPAPYAEYKGDKRYVLWYPDKAMAMKVWEYNQQGWPDPDPTADWPVEKRFTPEPSLQDIVDCPPPPKLTWTGGDGPWDNAATAWRDEAGRAVAWNPQAQALLAGPGGTVHADAKIACSGLTLGKGYTLVIGANKVDSRLSVVLEPGSTLEVTLDAEESNGRWGARISAAGYAKLGGTLALKGANLKPGTYHVIRASGKTEGTFDKVIPPSGWTTDSRGGSIVLKAAGTGPSPK